MKPDLLLTCGLYISMTAIVSSLRAKAARLDTCDDEDPIDYARRRATQDALCGVADAIEEQLHEAEKRA